MKRPSNVPNPLGQRLRALRKHRQLTLVELAQRSGVDKTTISLLERGQRGTTIQVMQRLLRALAVTLSEFYAGIEHAPVKVQVQSGSTRIASYTNAERGMTLQHLMSDILEKPFLPALLELQPSGQTMLEELRPGTTKFAYILTGTLVVDLGEDRYTLGATDSVVFDGAVPHTMRNPGTTLTRALLIVSPPAL